MNGWVIVGWVVWFAAGAMFEQARQAWKNWCQR